MKDKILPTLLLLAVVGFFISCEKEEDSGSGEYVPGIQVGSKIEFTPTQGGSVDWFIYEYNSNGVEACNSDGANFTALTWEYDRIDDDEIVVTTTFAGNAWEDFHLYGNGDYDYTGHTASGFTESHSGYWATNTSGCSSSSSSVGDVIFYVLSDFNCGTITVNLNGSSSTISSFYESAPDCGAAGCANFSNLPPAVYSFTATAGECTWNGSITVTANSCLQQPLAL